MTRSIPLILAALLLVPSLPAQSNTSASVTLFSGGRTLVRRTLPLNIPSGNSMQQLALGRLDAGTLMLLDPGVNLSQVTHDPGFDENSLLRRNVGAEFRFSTGIDKPVVTARLLGTDPEHWEITSPNTLSGVVLSRPGTILWDRNLIPAGPVIDVALTSDRARNSLSVMYETRGGNWSAAYRIFLGNDGRVEGVANINSGTLDLTDATVQLLAGDIGMKAAPPMPRAEMMSARAAAFDAVASNEALGEVRLYTLPGTMSFRPGITSTVPLFVPARVTPELKLSVSSGIPYYGGIGQMPDEVEVPVEVSYSFDRKLGTTFGDVPLPAGSVSVYDRDATGRVQLVGAGYIGHTSAGEPVEVATGTSFDVTARRTQTSYVTTVGGTPRRTTAQVGYRVVVRNAKDEPVKVEVREDRAGDWSVENSSVAPVRRSSSRVVFPLTVPARGEVTLTYQLRVVW
jgi:hypothetical protein